MTPIAIKRSCQGHWTNGKQKQKVNDRELASSSECSLELNHLHSSKRLTLLYICHKGWKSSFCAVKFKASAAILFERRIRFDGTIVWVKIILSLLSDLRSLYCAVSDVFKYETRSPVIKLYRSTECTFSRALSWASCAWEREKKSSFIADAYKFSSRWSAECFWPLFRLIRNFVFRRKIVSFESRSPTRLT